MANIIKRNIMLRSDITEHSFKGDIIGMCIGEVTDRKDTYENLCILLKRKGAEEGTVEWYGKNYGYVKVDRDLFPILSGTNGMDVTFCAEETPTKEDLGLFEATKPKKHEYPDEKYFAGSIGQNGTLAIEKYINKYWHLKYHNAVIAESKLPEVVEDLIQAQDLYFAKNRGKKVEIDWHRSEWSPNIFVNAGAFCATLTHITHEIA